MAARTTSTRRRSDYASLYKGHPGQWSWALHRITGVAVILFLFAHVLDTAMVGWGPEAYNRVTSAYKNPFVHLLELGLVTAVLYHAINGTKITLIDLFPSLAGKAKALGLASSLLFLAVEIPVAVIMLKQAIDLL